MKRDTNSIELQPGVENDEDDGGSGNDVIDHDSACEVDQDYTKDNLGLHILALRR